MYSLQTNYNKCLPRNHTIWLSVKKATRTYLWNAGGRKKQVPTDITPPNIIEIDKIPIYAQVLTSEQVAGTDVKAWDEVLADIDGLHAEVAEYTPTESGSM